MTQLILIGILTLINAFFAAAEMAMVSINRNKLTVLLEDGDKRAVLLDRLLNEPSKLLATIQVGITLAGFFSSAFAATGLSVGLGATLKSLGMPYGEQIALVLITVLLSFVMLLFGELFPKRLALQKTEAIALAAVRPVYYISRVTKPFVMLLSSCTNLLIRIFGLNHETMEQQVSEEEIRAMVKVGEEFGVINPTEKQMINAIFEFDDRLVREVMTPRLDVVMVDLAQSREACLKALVQLKYSRIPVYEKDKDKPVGIVHLKDILVAAKAQGFDGLNLTALVRPPYFVPETMAVDQLFIRLQKERQHMAMLIDEHGLMTGIVTMEDLIEEVMGDIDDEFDRHTHPVQLMKDGGFKVSGGYPLHDFNERFHVHIEEQRADTIGGYLVALEGQLPEKMVGKTYTIEHLTVTVCEAGERRIHSVVVAYGNAD